MKVDEVMNRNVYSCKPEDTLRYAAQLMWQHDIGCLVVIGEGGKALGMVTDRDLLMCAHLSGKGLEHQAVSQAMSKELHALELGRSVRDAEALMKSKQVRRLAIVNPEGRVAGIVSLNDLALAAGSRRAVKPEEVVATLASICQPRPMAAGAGN